MNLSKVIGILLIVISISAGYIGLHQIMDSTKEINFLGIKIDASNESGQLRGFMYTGAAIILLVGGLYVIQKPSKKN